MKHTGKARTFSILAGILLGAAGSVVPAQAEVMVYPQNGQPPEQVPKDQAECQGWAAQQSGYNPAGQSTTQKHSGARGAAAGAAIGAIAGDAGKGAAIGATAGGMKKGFQRRDQKKSAQAGASAYDEALRSCLTERGYTVQ